MSAHPNALPAARKQSPWWWCLTLGRARARHRGERLLAIDTAILDLVEYVCQRLQVLTGRTNVWLAVQITNLSIVVYFVWAAAFLVRSDALLRGFIAAFCLGLLYLLTQTVLRVPIEASETNAYRRVLKGLRNPRRVRDALLRVLFLGLCVLLMGPVAFIYAQVRSSLVLLTYSLIVLTTILLYVVACDPLPPGPERVRVRWLDRLTLRPAPAVRRPLNGSQADAQRGLPARPAPRVR